MRLQKRVSEDGSQVTTHSMTSRTPAHAALRALGGLCALAFLLAAPHPAFAQGRLDAQYEATLAGIPVGRGAWTIDISDDGTRQLLEWNNNCCVQRRISRKLLVISLQRR